MKTITIEISQENIDKLIDAEAVVMGGRTYIEKSIVVEALAQYAKEKVEELSND